MNFIRLPVCTCKPVWNRQTDRQTDRRMKFNVGAVQTTIDLSEDGAVVAVECTNAAVIEARYKPPQWSVKSHGCHGNRKFSAVGQDAHARHELNDELASFGVPYRDDWSFVGAHCVNKTLFAAVHRNYSSHYLQLIHCLRQHFTNKCLFEWGQRKRENGKSAALSKIQAWKTRDWKRQNIWQGWKTRDCRKRQYQCLKCGKRGTKFYETPKMQERT